MPSGVLPSRRQQILAVHGPFVRRLVEAALTPGMEREVDLLLASAQQQGWHELVGALRHILGGRRDTEVLGPLDEEDRVIAEAVLQGLQDPALLPAADSGPDATLAAPGLATLIRAAGSGDVQALQILGEMAGQMSKVGGDMARLAGVIRPLVNGERRPERLVKGMSAQGERLVLDILSALGETELH
jgi:hypothetical protein